MYSYSKSLSLPGERIGWILVPDTFRDYEEMIAAMVIANRCMGSVNAPSLMQRVIGRCADVRVDVEYYDRNRTLLYDALSRLGFACTKPEGAFYLFMKVPEGDEKRFFADMQGKPGSAGARIRLRLSRLCTNCLLRQSRDDYKSPPCLYGNSKSLWPFLGKRIKEAL